MLPFNYSKNFNFTWIFKNITIQAISNSLLPFKNITFIPLKIFQYFFKNPTPLPPNPLKISNKNTLLLLKTPNFSTTLPLYHLILQNSRASKTNWPKIAWTTWTSASSTPFAWTPWMTQSSSKSQESLCKRQAKVVPSSRTWFWRLKVQENTTFSMTWSSGSTICTQHWDCKNWEFPLEEQNPPILMVSRVRIRNLRKGWNFW